MELSRRIVSLQKKLVLIYAMNVADWICTVALLSTGGFYEANPLARAFIGSIPLGLLVKCVLPAAMIFVIQRMARLLDPHGLRVLDRFVAFALTFYTALCFLHMINFVLLFFGLALD